MTESQQRLGVGIWLDVGPQADTTVILPVLPEDMGKVERTNGHWEAITATMKGGVGGGVKAGESLMAALHREAWQERRLLLVENSVLMLPLTMQVAQQRKGAEVNFEVVLFRMAIGQDALSSLREQSPVYEVGVQRLAAFMADHTNGHGLRPFAQGLVQLMMDNNFFRS